MTKTNKSLKSLLLFLLFIPAFSAMGQKVSNSCRITGHVKGVVLKHNDRASARYEIQVGLVFKNVSADPVIILKKDFWMAGEDIFTIGDKSELVYSTSHLSSMQPDTIRAGWRRVMDKDLPPDNLFKIVDPNGSFETNAIVSVYVLKKNKQYADIWAAIRERKPLLLTVTTEMFPRGYDMELKNGQRFTDMLSTKWKRIGALQSELISSERIEIIFPQTPAG